jgi:hypothetical protein
MIPGSALRKLEAITGLEATKLAVGYQLKYGPGVGFFSAKKDEKDACEELRRANWKRIQGIVGARQGWKCLQCGRIVPLGFHHVNFRSRWRRSDGPLDHESNVEGLCLADHQKEHGIK